MSEGRDFKDVDLAVSKIGEQLRASFDQVVNEPVPDRFADLLNQLEEQEGDDKSRDNQ